MQKTKLFCCLFKDLKIGTKFVSLKTYPLTGKIFQKIEDIPPKRKWSIHSNALMLDCNLPIHMEDKVVCIPESEFHKFIPR